MIELCFQLLVNLFWEFLSLIQPIAEDFRSILSQFYTALRFSDRRDITQPENLNHIFDGQIDSRKLKRKDNKCVGPAIYRRSDWAPRRCHLPLMRYLIESLSVLDLKHRAELKSRMMRTSIGRSSEMQDFGIPKFGEHPAEATPDLHTAAPNILELLETLDNLRHRNPITGEVLVPDELPTLRILGIGNPSSEVQPTVRSPMSSVLSMSRSSLTRIFPIRIPPCSTQPHLYSLYSLDLHLWPTSLPIGFRVSLSLCTPIDLSMPESSASQTSGPKSQLIADTIGCSNAQPFWLLSDPSSAIQIDDDLKITSTRFQTARPSSRLDLTNSSDPPYSPAEILKMATDAICPTDEQPVTSENAEMYLGGSGVPLSEKLPMRGMKLNYAIEWVEETSDCSEYVMWAEDNPESEIGNSIYYCTKFSCHFRCRANR